MKPHFNSVSWVPSLSLEDKAVSHGAGSDRVSTLVMTRRVNLAFDGFMKGETNRINNN